MKKLLILVLTISMCFVMAGCSKQKKEAPAANEITTLMYESETVKITFDGLDEEMPGVRFIVENKTDAEYMFIMQTIEVDGKKETQEYSNVVQSKEKTVYTAKVSSIKDFNTVNAEVVIQKMDGSILESFEIKEKRIK